MPSEVQDTADNKYEILKSYPDHPSLDFKEVGESKVGPIYRAKVTQKRYRALAIRVDDGIYVWFWIGKHDDYERLIN